MNIDQTAEKLLKHLFFLQANIEVIDSVNIYNTFSESFGRKYCNVKIDINTKENLSPNLTEIYNKTLLEHFGNYFNEIDFHYSYYLTDNDDSQEQMHYEYITSFLCHYLKRRKVKVFTENFVSLADLKRTDLEWMANYELKTELLKKSMANIRFQNGQYLATKGSPEGDMRISLITEIVYGKENKILSLSTNEVLKNLSISSTTKDRYLNVNDFFAVFNSIPKCNDKLELIAIITNNISFDGLVWRRPKDL
jgi:hypothetical protein